MTRISKLFITLLDPFHVGRTYIFFPVWGIIHHYYVETIEKTKSGVLSIRDLVLRCIILLLAFGVILWTAVFMYVGFYYSFMPVTMHSKPAHMQFKSCENGKEICSFPQAHVPLTKKQQLLMVGQPYRVLVVIEMPESPVNQDVGMFLVCAEMRDSRSSLIAHSCRTGILHYKSTLLTWIVTWIKVPFYVTGLREEKQEVEVELFTTFHDDDNAPVTDVYVEIQSKQIQFYSVSLLITAHFTGLRYFMFHWPVLAATIGICTNLFFIILICLLSWYHYTSDTDWLDEAKEKFEELKKQAFGCTTKTSDTESNSSVDDIQEDVDEDKTSIRYRKTAPTK